MLPEARHVVLPKGIVSSGFPSVRETCRRIGIEFDPWQVDLNRALLAKGSDGLYAADTVLLSIARQVGKTFDVGAVVFALCIAQPGLTVVWTAHRFKVARETFNELRGLAKAPKLTAHIAYDEITTAAGNESIPFRNGSRIVFAARERGAIRGFTKVGVLVLDEGQILTHAALADLAPTMNQAANPLIIIMGTPPKPNDPGEVFTDLRAAALDGSADDVLYVEFSAGAGADPDDREAWRQANPSYPTRTPARAILRLRKLLSEDDFLREALGIWDQDRLNAVIPAATWRQLADFSAEPAPHVGEIVLGVDSDPDQAWTSIVAAGFRGDGLPMVEVTSDAAGEVDNRAGLDWALERVKAIGSKLGASMSVMIGKRSTASVLVKPLTEAGIRVTSASSADEAQACTVFYTSVVEGGRLRHLDQAQMLDALKAAKKRASGDAWVWDKRSKAGDITPLTAGTLALWGLLSQQGQQEFVAPQRLR